MNTRRNGIILILLIFTVILGITAVYIASRLGWGPFNEPQTIKASTAYGIEYYFNDGGGICSLEQNNADQTICLVINDSNMVSDKYQMLSSNYCNGKADSNSCVCTSTNDWCANRTPSEWDGGPAYKEPSDVITKYWTKDSKNNPEYYTSENMAKKVCVQREWCGSQQIFFSTGKTSTFECYLSTTTIGLESCVNAIDPSKTPTNTPENTQVMTPEPTDTPYATVTTAHTRTPIPTEIPVATPTTTSEIIPDTSIITDEVDRLIIGIVLVIFGVYIYKSGKYIQIGDLFWQRGGKDFYNKTAGNIDSIYSKISNQINKFYSKTGDQLVLVEETINNNINKTEYAINDTVNKTKQIILSSTTKLENTIDTSINVTKAVVSDTLNVTEQIIENVSSKIEKAIKKKVLDAKSTYEEKVERSRNK